MFLTVLAILIILLAHFLGDFYWQTTEMAVGKSKDNNILRQHVVIYAIPLTVAALYISSFMDAAFFGASIIWLILNVGLHYVTDYYTSRENARITAKEGMGHNFFVMIGFDQLIHFFTLITTAALLLFTR